MQIPETIQVFPDLGLGLHPALAKTIQAIPDFWLAFALRVTGGAMNRHAGDSANTARRSCSAVLMKPADPAT